MFTFYQSGQSIPKSWILLDSQSTVDMFCNLDLLENIHQVSESMSIRCNAGTWVTNLVRELPGNGPVNPVPHNNANYTMNDFMRAMWARELQMIIGCLSTADYIKMVQQNILLNCPITPCDIQAAELIFGQDVRVLKGKTTWC